MSDLKLRVAQLERTTGNLWIIVNKLTADGTLAEPVLCDKCGGSGDDFDENGMLRCAACFGTGEVKEEHAHPTDCDCNYCVKPDGFNAREQSIAETSFIYGYDQGRLDEIEGKQVHIEAAAREAVNTAFSVAGYSNAPPADTTYLTTPEAAIEIDAEVDRLKDERRQAYTMIDMMNEVGDGLKEELRQSHVMIEAMDKVADRLRDELDQACGRMEKMYKRLYHLVPQSAAYRWYETWFDSNGKAIRGGSDE